MIVKIKYKETEIPISVGYSALKQFKLETKKEFKSVNLEEIQDLEILFWFAICAGYKQSEEINPFKREEMEDVLDVVLFEFIAKLPDFFLQSPTKADKTETEKS